MSFHNQFALKVNGEVSFCVFGLPQPEPETLAPSPPRSTPAQLLNDFGSVLQIVIYDVAISAEEEAVK